MAGGNIHIRTIDDGGNPRDQAAIEQVAPNAFRVIPFSEDGDPNYKFRCEFLAVNSSGQAHPIQLQIHWQDTRFAKYRRQIYLKHETGSKWSEYPMAIAGGTACGPVLLAPGVTRIAAQPAYNLNDLALFLDRWTSAPGITVETIGRTRENRDIYQVVLNDKVRAASRRSILIACRIHPYESAGSFCAEGIVEGFVQGCGHLAGKIRGWRIHLIPMANPDGVYSGLCKRTASGGIDLSKQIDPTEPTCSALLACLDSIRPDVYCELHNWMLPDVDGIYNLNRFKAARYIRRLPGGLFKPWKIALRKKLFAVRPEGLKHYCHRKLTKKAFVLELPWKGRSVDRMKIIGAAALGAMPSL